MNHDSHRTAAETRYRIITSELGSMISESRVSVLDVLEAVDAGESLYSISAQYNLTPLQVQVALDYIARHRETLEQQLTLVVAQQAEQERYYRAMAAAIDAQIAAEPLTSERAQLRTLRERQSATYSWTVDEHDPERS